MAETLTTEQSNIVGKKIEENVTETMDVQQKPKEPIKLMTKFNADEFKLVKTAENENVKKEETEKEMPTLEQKTLDAIKKLFETDFHHEPQWWDGKEDLVISGISGRYPESLNVREFLQNLYAGVDLMSIDDRRWTPGLYDLPLRNGKLKDIKRFDYSFFGMQSREAKVHDPQLSIMLETTYEALYDSGIDPASLRGTNTGVFVANSVNETNFALLYDKDGIDENTYYTCRSTFASKVAFHFDLTGPSMTFDTACSSTFLAIQHAVDSLRKGECESALVCGTHLTLSYYTSIMFLKMGMLSPTGFSKSFDATGNGYVRGECIGTIFLQRASKARRIYATVVHAKSNTDGYKTEGITFPGALQQSTLLKEVYQEANVNPNEVTYVEAHGTGTAVGDFVEGVSISNAFLNDVRKDPLLIGSVKSNCGHAEPASGIAAMTKVIGALQYNCLPQNLHFTSPNPSIPALVEGRLKVVDKNIPWSTKIVALNNFGFGGSNTHIILRANDKVDHNVKFSDNESDIPTLLLHSGRTKKALDNVFHLFKIHCNNLYLYRMLMEQNSTDPNLFPFRGFMISRQENVDLIQINPVKNVKRNVCFAYSGSNVFNRTYFNELMKIVRFKKSFEICSNILGKLGIDLAKLLKGSVPNDQESNHIFLFNIALQIALTDVLHFLGVKCNSIIGDNIGEILSFYANGLTDYEATLNSSYLLAKNQFPIKQNGFTKTNNEAVASQIKMPETGTKHRFVNVLNSSDFNDFLSYQEESQLIILQLSPENMRNGNKVPDHCKWCNLTGNDYNINKFLTVLGNLYLLGINVKVQNLYPEVDYPAPRDTPMLASSFDWHHSILFGQDYDPTKIILNSARTFPIDPFANSSKEKFLLDHVIDGHVLYPLAGYLVLAWKTFCHVNHKDYKVTPVILENVRIHSATILSKPVRLHAGITIEGGKFVLCNEGQIIADGVVKFVDQNPSDDSFHYGNINKYPLCTTHEVEIDGEDIYNELRLRGYEYGPSFQGIRKGWISGEYSQLAWTGNWITFIDTLLQTHIFVQKESVLRVPIRIEYLQIDPLRHAKSVEKCSDGTNAITAQFNLFTWGVVAGGVELYGMITQVIHARSALQQKASLEWIEPIPYYDANCLTRFPNLQKNLHEYAYACQSASKNIIKNLIEKKIFLDNSNFNFETSNNNVEISDKQKLLFENEVEKYVLLAVLTQFNNEISSENFTEGMDDNENNIKELKMLMPNVDRDPLVNFAWSEPVMTDLMDICLHNRGRLYWYTTIVEPTSLAIPETVCRYDYQRLRAQPITMLVKMLGPGASKLKRLDTNSLELETFDFNLETDNEEAEYYDKQDVIILDRLLYRKADIKQYLDRVSQLLDNGGFLLVSEVTGCFELAFLLHVLNNNFELKNFHSNDPTRKYGLFYEHSKWLNIFETCGFHIISYRCDNLMTSLYALRKIRPQPLDPLFLTIDDNETFKWFEPLKAALVQRLAAPAEQTIVLFENKEYPTGTYGMTQSFQIEYEFENRIRSFTNVPKSMDPTNSKDIQKQLQYDLLVNNYHNGQWGTFRRYMFSDEDREIYKDTEHAYINTMQPGMLSSLTWMESPLQFYMDKTDSNGTVNIASVYYSALNFRDIMLSSGRLASDFLPHERVKEADCHLGIEFVGRCQKTGKRIMGIPTAARGIATTVVYDSRLAWNIPDDWSMEQAATVPVAYCTAYYAMLIRGQIRRGEKILIHAGAGGVGIAAITLAYHYGLVVFTTVGSEEKKNFLLQRFPKLDVKHISSSRSMQFEIDIMQATNGKGVDLVLNSLAENLLQASVRCLARNGRFLEIGKFDLAMNNQIDVELMKKNASFHGIVLDLLFNDLNEITKTLSPLMKEGIDEKIVAPLPTTVFSLYEVESAFRFMAQGKHMGKVLIKLRDEEQQRVTIPRPLLLKARAQALCNPHHVYILVGGLGGMGLEVTQWLINRGATKLFITSRKGLSTGYHRRSYRSWILDGLDVNISTLDISKYDETEQLLTEAKKHGPIGGIFNMSLALIQDFFVEHSVEDFQYVCGSKCNGTRNLDIASRKLCSEELKWFVLFSSVITSVGNYRQTVYGYANSYAETIISERQQDGLPALSIQWGAIGDVGIYYRYLNEKRLAHGSMSLQRMASCLQVLDFFLCCNRHLVTSYVMTEKKSLNVKKGEDVTAALARIMGITDLSQINENLLLVELGLDSLMAMELKQTMESQCVNITTKDLKTITVGELGQRMKKAMQKNKAKA